MNRKKNLALFAAATAVLAVLVFLADVNEFIDAISSASLDVFALATFFGVLVTPIWAYTWYRMLKNLEEGLTYLDVLPMFAAGGFMNSVTPLGQFGGEPVMAYIIRRNTDLEYEEAFSAVLSSDIINMVPIFSFALTASFILLFQGPIPSRIKTIIYLGLAIMFAMIIASYFIWFRSHRIKEGFNAILTPFEDVKLIGKHVEGLQERIETALDAFRRLGEEKKSLVATALVAHLGLTFRITAFWLVLYSLGHTVNPLTLLFILPLAALSNFAPTPGGAGAFEAGLGLLTYTLTSLGAPQALAAAVLFRLATFWPNLLIGYLGLLQVEAE